MAEMAEMAEMATIRQFGLLGWPLAHSLSPVMQEAAFRHLGIPASYVRVPVPGDGLEACIQRLRDTGWAGWNVTVPHKGAVIRFLDEVEPLALRMQSVNTVVRVGDRLLGTSTDGYGLEQALLEAFNLPVAGRRIAFIGAGGAVRAVAGYLALAGARQVTLLNRTIEHASQLAAAVRTLGSACTVSVVPLSQAAAALPGHDVVVQGTSLGLQDGDPLPLDPGAIPGGMPVFDMIYRETPWLQAARERGHPAADGLAMLLHQGALAFSRWTGQAAPVDVMRAALLAARGCQR
jgi:shikimate dehydrogenase